MAVFSGPAASAAHVAGSGGIHQDQPGGCCSGVPGAFADGLVPRKAASKPRFSAVVFDHVGVQAVQVAVHKLHPFVFRVADIGADRFKGFFFERIAHELLGNISTSEDPCWCPFQCVSAMSSATPNAARWALCESVHCGCHNSNSLISEMLCVLSVNRERGRFPQIQHSGLRSRSVKSFYAIGHLLYHKSTFCAIFLRTNRKKIRILLFLRQSGGISFSFCHSDERHAVQFVHQLLFVQKRCVQKGYASAEKAGM